ncbi:MAG: TonB-dependent receptor [Lewinellaceae bacterium]|nr:TonB-dependent receptor [Lewinellaceae bacterium]
MKNGTNWLLALALGLFSLSSLQAQNGTATLKGQVNGPDSAPIAYANIILHQVADSSIAKVEITNEEGQFELVQIPAGDYWVEVSYVGMASFNSKRIVLNPGDYLSLDAFQLEDASQELKEVTVTAARPLLEIKPDRTVFNVEGSINAQGSTALELLRKSPGVVVDNNDNISMLGRSGVRVYIDGKPSPLRGADLANYLQSLQSSQIDAIEIITNPSARFDAEGNAGIINIRLKKDQKLGSNANVDLSSSRGEKAQYNGTVNANYRNQAVNVFGNVSYWNGENLNYMSLYREQLGVVFNQRNNMVNEYGGFGFKAGADLFLSKKSTIGFLANGNFHNGSQDSDSRTLISSLGISTIDSILVAQSTGTNSRDNANFNLNYRFDDSKGKVFNIDLDYGQFRNDGDEYQPNYYLDANGETILQERINATLTPTNIDIYTFKMDHERPFLGGQLSTGIKSAMVNTDNTFNFFNIIGGNRVLNTDRSNQFDYSENVNAAYLSYGRQVKKWNLQFGVRAEQTNSTGELTAMNPSNDDRVKRSYLDIFPSGGVTYAINQNHSFGLNYSRRINRPSYQDLNPFRSQLDELTFEQGNPFLRPEYANIVELSHTFKYKLNTKLSYSHTRDQITRFTDTSGVSATYITWLNLSDQYTYSLNVSAPLPIKEWWSTYTSVTGSHSRNKADYGEGKTVDLEATAFNIYTQHSFRLPHDWTLELSGWYNSPSLWGGTFEMNAMWNVDFGVQKKIMDGRGNLRLAVSDIFKTTNWWGTSKFGVLDLNVHGGWDSRRVRLSVNYLLGNTQVKGARRRTTGLEDEKSRVKSE